ncbi:NAD(P)/FAD-dependent oxidoreductase [Flavisphingomonas formosensis]|uniref:NAD(P)/FAD-dependent oxidoreductase n=1 Tax=Flavisphingomonas formosensis TaxID=861534 RepID=UPI0012FA1754|nr:FAD-dependent oxidoreductase [Sphingomonas formosensis]
MRTDIAVIGAGIMGTSAALSLAEQGAGVVVLEAGEIGEGASSRPGGFVVPHFSVGSPAEVRERIGDDADRTLQLAGGSAQAVFDRIRTLGIDCDASQTGWYHPAHSAGAFARVRAIAEQWTALGFPGELLDAAETEIRTGARGYAGSWYAPTGGTLHPLRYCRGLADAAIARGARIHEQSAALAIERRAGRYLIRTSKGELIAEKVVVCTNGLASELVPPMTASIVPLRVWQCATEPLPASWRAHLFQRGECLSDTRRNLFTYRFDADGRLITGALDAAGVSGERAGRAMARRLARELRLPGVPRIEYLWWGDSSLSATRLPATLVVDGGVLSATACNARGIALSTVVGEAVGRYALGGERPPVTVLGDAARSTARLQSRLSRFYPHFAPLLDWLDTRRSHA